MMPDNFAAPRPRPIFLMTDFGLADHYVAAMKAVILGRCPDVQFIDITHEVPPQGVAQGCYLLESIEPWLPPESVVLAVVDPGVGTAREAAVFCAEGRLFIGPNNGLFGFLPGATPGRRLDRPEFWLPETSHTFHGRDIFAPCAAYLAAGGGWDNLGSMDAKPVVLPPALNPAIRADNPGRIIHFDHYGNAVTTIPGSYIKEFEAQSRTGALTAEVAGKMRCPVEQTFGVVRQGEPVAYAGSTGRLEIAVRDGNAQQRLGLSLGDEVFIAVDDA